ncbi:transcription termination factor MTERF4, chloroplastic [Amborella trichopoda]|nr:transcription termination factor MTERF4, chloroplastic [Amborella trichopoda]XP_020526935.1 transcription termination factor MTERF4, chloroplastic [Amborella trichopoda]XP_020526936.1 transcription termination factor MTERF4, chloroplastic [Amborella trichopoda]XP_020526937.1 transcription termination factor MTERF4, chloroplastic [Amborella trichopoda]XP_020526938.1 transcription termination factor MTERF4, chloroplastic [Amborella trichopoda]XP_020526939.1 transcription termination factor MT|eukprot:XP_020526934.1 transcription termination factor MTERF4, chloroplastic [Amborella trichopoda]
MISCSHVTCNIKDPETMKALCRGITCPHFESSSLSFNFPYFKPWNKILFLGGQKKIGVRARNGFSIDAKMWSSATLDASSQQQISIQTDRKPNRSSSLYSRPSLLEMQKEKQTNRAMVYEFLKGIGIVPDELEGLELPVSIDVMRDRVDFLHKLGLTIQDINNYPLVLGCSVKKNMIPVLDYLGKLGVRKSNFTEFLRRYPQVLHSSVVIDLAPVVKYLQGLDIKPNDIPGVLERYPEVLGFKLEGTMSTSVAYLVGIGVARREIGGILTRYPEILGMRVARVIKPFVEYLEAIGIPRQGVARLIEKRPHILGFSFDDGVKRNVDVLLESGVRKEALSSIVMQYPEILGLELEPRIVSQQHFFNFNLDISPEEFGKVVEKMPQVVSLSQTPVIKHVEFLKNCGFSTENVKRMVLACPLVLALNLDIMRLSFDYFQTEMGRGLEELVEYPAFFTYSLESTIKPRHRRIAEKGLKCSLAWLLNCSDQKFEERLDYDYIDIEEMKTEPSFSMASRLAQSADESTSEDADYSEDEDF